MEMQLDVWRMRIAIKMVNARGVERARPADNAVDLADFGEKELGKIRTILAGDSCNECFFHLDSHQEK